MKKLLFTTLITVVITGVCFAQEEKYTSERAQSVYGELGGNGLFFSGNYDFRFLKSQKGLGMRVGIGFFGGSGGGLISVPVGLNYLAGKAPNYLEVGLGYTFASFTSPDDFFNGETGSILVPSIGYRYQPLKKGFTGRVFIAPLISLGGGGGWLFWGGVSAGYKF